MQFEIRPVRVKRGERIVESKSRIKDCNNTVADVLMDLIHFAKATGIDFDKELALAKEHVELYK